MGFRTTFNFYHNSIYQLNVLPNINSLNSNSSIKSLFDVINFTSTSMGKRLLKYRLSNPIINSDKLNLRYKLIEIFNKNSQSNDLILFEKLLNEIVDIERFHRKMSLQYLQPFEFYSLTSSYENIIIIYNKIKKYYSIKDLDLDINIYNKFKKFKNDYENIFILNEMAKYI